MQIGLAPDSDMGWARSIHGPSCSTQGLCELSTFQTRDPLGVRIERTRRRRRISRGIGGSSSSGGGGGDAPSKFPLGSTLVHSKKQTVQGREKEEEETPIEATEVIGSRMKVNSHVIELDAKDHKMVVASQIVPQQPLKIGLRVAKATVKPNTNSFEGGPQNEVPRNEHDNLFLGDSGLDDDECSQTPQSSKLVHRDARSRIYRPNGLERSQWRRICWVFILVNLIICQGCVGQIKEPLAPSPSVLSSILSSSSSNLLWSSSGLASTVRERRDSLSSGDIRFSSGRQVYQSKVGDSIQLDCQVDNLGSTVITWYKGDRILSAGNLKILDEPRIDILSGPSGISVLIQDVQMSDQGPYACEVNLMDKPLRITHELKVLVPPSIQAISGNGRITARKGSRVSLNCSATGHPTPNIHWEREHRKYFSSGRLTERGATLSLTDIGRSDEGTYICVADNQVSQPVTAQILLNVLYPPEVHVESPWVHSGLGDSAQLECLVQGNPQPEVNWYKGSMKLSDGERHSMVTIGNRYILTIDSVIQSDFGNYSCISENVLGKSRGTTTQVTLTGAPTKPKIVSLSSGQHRYSYHVKWKVISEFPIRQHRIEYWPHKVNSMVGREPSSSLSSDYGQESPLNSRERILKLSEIDHDPVEGWFAYNIKGLQPQTKYEIRAQVQNEMGWSPNSDAFEFSTSHIENVPKELQSRPGDESSLIVPVGNQANAHATQFHIAAVVVLSFWPMVFSGI